MPHAHPDPAPCAESTHSAQSQSQTNPDQPKLTTSAGAVRAQYITCDQPSLVCSELDLQESDVNINWSKLQIINPIRLAYKLAELLNEDMPEINLQSNYIMFKDVVITLYLSENLKKQQIDRKKLLLEWVLALKFQLECLLLKVGMPEKTENFSKTALSLM